VIKLLKYVWVIFKRFRNTKFVWSWPRHAEVLIFDSPGLYLLMKYLEPWDPELLYIRGEQLNVRVFLRSLFRGGGKLENYIDCFIDKVRPRLIVTFVDNDVLFYKLGLKHPEVKTLFVQNGWRDYKCFKICDRMEPKELDKLFVDYMLVFGSVVGEHFSQFVKGCTVPVGSLSNNFTPKINSPKQGVIAFVSGWRPLALDGEFNKTGIEYIMSCNLIVPFLEDYAKKKNKRFMIVPCSIAKQSAESASRKIKSSNFSNIKKTTWISKDEKAFFARLLGHEPEFIENEDFFPSYQAIDSAEVVIAVDSTLGYESIARGNKTGIFAVSSNFVKDKSLKFGWPGDFSGEGLYWTDKADPARFTKILDYLFEVDDAQWRKDLEVTNFSSLMVYDPGNTIFKETIEKGLCFASIDR
jgi:surface carbohydrate biosynthesis protein